MKFSEKKIIVLSKEIINPSLISDSQKLNLIKDKTETLIWENFNIEKLLKIVYKEKKTLRISLNKKESINILLQKCINNILWNFNFKVRFNWLYTYFESNGIRQIEPIAVINKENIYKKLRNKEENNISSTKILIPIYKFIKIDNKNNIKWYLSADIIKWDYDKIFFMLNIIFWAWHDIISELFELKHKNIREKFMFDQLTKIYTRKCFYEKLKNDILNKKEREEFYLMFLDIDNFSNINNTYWHDVWDEILKKFTWWIKKNIRNWIDYVGRWWWEEFIILFKFDKIFKKENIKNIFNNKKENIKKKSIYKYKYKKIEIRPTFSWWVVSMREINYNLSDNKVENIIEKLVKKADERMYKAKKSWKDKIIFED